jgi:CheY-like chemotaxis protein
MTKTILLADDSVTIQKVVELTFMDQDYQVIAVSDGKAALDRLAKMQPDLVIADVHMPEANGYEVCRHAKKTYPGIPVLLLVGTFEPFDQQQASAAGADSHLKKPFDSQDLLRQVDSLISQTAAPPAPASAAAAPHPASTPPAAPAAAAQPAAPQPAAPWAMAPQPAVPRAVAPPPAASAPPPAPEPPFFDLPEPEPLAFEPERPPRDTAPEPPIFAPEPEPFELEPEPFELEPELPEPEPAAVVEPPPPVRAAPRPAVPEAPTRPPVPAAAPAAGVAASAAGASAAGDAGAGEAGGNGTLSEEDVERVARRVVELVGDSVIRQVAWEVVPDLAEVVIRERIRELEGQVE